MLRNLILITLLLFSQYSLAKAQYQLDILPEKCAVTSQSPRCQSVLLVDVTADSNQQLCVTIEEQQQCRLAQANTATRFEFHIDTVSSQMVTLTDAQQRFIMHRKFMVFQYIEQPKRPKRGYLWNSL